MFTRVHYKKGVAWWVVVVAVAVVIIAGIIVSSTTDNGGNGNTGDNDNNLCPSYCLAFVELECGTNKVVDGCFGLWDCDDGVVNECR